MTETEGHLADRTAAASPSQWSIPRAQMLTAIWGFAEATVFFIVPDVLLTWLALHDRRGTWLACFWALAGALAGGALMYAWGACAPSAAHATLERVPAVNAGMIAGVKQQLESEGATALLQGPVNGVPYKIYAVQAGALALPLWSVLAISVPARLARFAVITGLTLLACRMFPATPVLWRRFIHVTLWTLFYAWYFWRFSGAP